MSPVKYLSVYHKSYQVRSEQSREGGIEGSVFLQQAIYCFGYVWRRVNYLFVEKNLCYLALFTVSLDSVSMTTVDGGTQLFLAGRSRDLWRCLICSSYSLCGWL